MNVRVKLAAVVAVVGAMAVAGSVAAAGSSSNSKTFLAALHGYEEVPAISTQGGGAFKASLSTAGNSFSYQLVYSDLESTVTQAHIHFGQMGVNGGISAFFCSNLGNGPMGTQVCPPPPAIVTGTITATDVIGPAGQGIAAGQFDELLKAIRAGATYTNVHTTGNPGGEIRGQVKAG